tara:strand:+ start:271 stop:420 length:150 start_codon:yes stop_codon:yes gene_type:complete
MKDNILKGLVLVGGSNSEWVLRGAKILSSGLIDIVGVLATPICADGLAE